MTSDSGIPAGESTTDAARAALDAYFNSSGADPALKSHPARGPRFSGEPDWGQSLDAARNSVQDLVAGFGEPPFDDCPVEWLGRPFARIRWLDADGTGGAQVTATWVFDFDQRGTVLIELVERYGSDFAAVPSPADILADLSGSIWLQNAMREALARDPVDAANDAAVLARILAQRVQDVVSAARARMKERSNRSDPG
jgi:hypothetical protein